MNIHIKQYHSLLFTNFLFFVCIHASEHVSIDMSYDIQELPHLINIENEYPPKQISQQLKSTQVFVVVKLKKQNVSNVSNLANSYSRNLIKTKKELQKTRSVRDEELRESYYYKNKLTAYLSDRLPNKKVATVVKVTAELLYPDLQETTFEKFFRRFAKKLEVPESPREGVYKKALKVLKLHDEHIENPYILKKHNKRARTDDEQKESSFTKKRRTE